MMKQYLFFFGAQGFYFVSVYYGVPPDFDKMCGQNIFYIV